MSVETNAISFIYNVDIYWFIVEYGHVINNTKSLTLHQFFFRETNKSQKSTKTLKTILYATAGVEKELRRTDGTTSPENRKLL